MTPSGDFVFLCPVNGCNIHKVHLRPTKVPSNMPTHHISNDTCSFEAIILSHKIIGT